VAVERTIVQLVDDLDKTSLAKRHIIAVDDDRHAIDLNDEHHGELLEALARFIKVARSLSKPAKLSPEQLKAIRHWGHTEARNPDSELYGFEFSDRGIIPARVMEAFHKAHASRPHIGSNDVAVVRSKTMFSDAN
jgi:Lsr2